VSDDRYQGDLKLRQLRIFREVLRLGSTRRAAAALGISQPAVSQQIKQLENALDLALFERTSNRIIASHKAWELLRSVDDALTSFDRLEVSIDEIKTQDKAPVSIAAASVFGLVSLPRVVGILREKSSFHLRSISGSDEQVKEHILSGRADIGIARLPLDPRLFEWSQLATAGNVCIFHPEHRFTRHEHVTAQDLVGEAIIDIDPHFATHQMNINALRFRGYEPDIVVEYDDTGHEAGFVSAGLGVSITNEVIAHQYASFQIGVRPFTPSALYHYVAIWQKGRVLSNAIETSLHALRMAFGALSWQGGPLTLTTAYDKS